MSIFDQIRNGFQQGFGKGGQLDPNRIFNQIQGGVKQVADQAENGINQLGNKIKGEINQVGSDVKKASYAVQGEVASNVNRVANDAKSLAETAKTQLEKAGQDVINKITSEEKQIEQKIVDAGHTVVGKIDTAVMEAFHQLEDELKHEAVKKGLKTTLATLERMAKYGAGFIPDTSITMAFISFDLSGLGDLGDDGTTGIEKLIKHFTSCKDIEWTYESISNFILGLGACGVDFRVTVVASVTVVVEIGASFTWSISNVVKNIDRVVSGELGLTKATS